MSADVQAALSGDVLLVASNGGHLLPLLQLAELWPRERRQWVTFEKSDPVSLLAAQPPTFRLRATTLAASSLLYNGERTEPMISNQLPRSTSSP